MLEFKKLRKDNDTRYAQLAFDFTKEICQEASTPAAFKELFNKRVAAYRCALPTKMAEHYQAEDWGGNIYVMKSITQKVARAIYRIIEGGAS